MQHLAAARETLLDAGQRSVYDRRASAQQPQGPRPSAPTGSGNWVELAEEYLAQNDYHSAAYAAREATQVEGNSPRAWNLRGRANAGLGNFNDALYEVRQAAEIEPNNAQHHFDLGSVCEQVERWKDALTAYERAAALDPSAILFRVSVAGVYLQNDLPDEALPMLEELHRAHPKEEMVNFYLAACLHDLAERVPQHNEADSYVITSPEEIGRMEALVAHANGLRHNDRELQASLDTITAYIDKCKQIKFSPPPFVANQGLGAIGFVLLVPIIGIFVALGVFGEDPGAGFVLLLMFALTGFGVFKLFWVPVWKKNLRSFR